MGRANNSEAANQQRWKQTAALSSASRWRRCPTRPPRYEESLTEIFAAVLRRSPEAPYEVATKCGLADLARDETVTIDAQRPAAGLERVDVELLFDSPTAGRRCLWLELKWDAKPDASQVVRYADHLKQMSRHLPWKR